MGTLADSKDPDKMPKFLSGPSLFAKINTILRERST